MEQERIKTAKNLKPLRLYIYRDFYKKKEENKKEMQTHTLEEMYGQLAVQKKNIKINDKNSIKNKDRPLLNLKKQIEFMCFFKFNNSLSFLRARK